MSLSALARDFLRNFADVHGEPKYLKILVSTAFCPEYVCFIASHKSAERLISSPRSYFVQQDVANRRVRSVQIELDDLFNVSLICYL